MKSTKRVLVLLLLLQFYFCFAESAKIFGQYRFDNWTTDNGLPQNGVRSIAQTPDGYLWFTTYDGLVRFDGFNFTTFNKGNTKGILNNRFTSIYVDKDGTVYATTMEDGILTVYRDGVFTTYNSEQVPGHYIQIIKPDENGELRFLVEDDARTSKTWYYLRDGKFVFSEKYALQADEKIVLQGKSGAIWTVGENETTELRDGKTTVYPLKLDRAAWYTGVYEDREGNLWVGENKVYCLRNGKIRYFTEKDGLPSNSAYHSFWEEADGSLWFASGGNSSTGIGLIQYQNGRMTFHHNSEDFANASIHNVFRDREGTIWLATDKGLSRLRKEVVHALSVKNGLVHTEVYPILRDRHDDIWVGTSKGLSVFRNGKFETLKFKAHPNSPHAVWTKWITSVQSLFEDANGRMWIGLNGSIFVAENDRAELLKGGEGSHVLAIQSDREGNVWAATNKGLLKFRDYKVVAQYSVKDGLPNEFMTTIFEDSKGNLWFGGMGGLSALRDGKFVNYTTRNGLTGNYVRSIYEDADGTFWIGTYDEGMSRFKDGVFVNYKAENGLSNNGVFAIREDSRNNFWISSNRGIYRVERQELNDFADGKIDRINSVGYGREDGMLSNECNGGRQPASATDKDGNFWFATQNGVAVVNPAAETYNSLMPPVVIESATVEREKIDIHRGLRVEAGQRNIEIKFTGISLIKSEQIKFKYKLEGHDENWVEAGTQRTAYYSSLPPGNYRFVVKAANSDGIWSAEGAAIDLDLQPFFYQTTAFYLLCVAIGTLFLFLVWQFSVYQLKARERKLAKMVNEKTRELRKANDELQFLANSDGLTKIGNRRLFEDFLEKEWHRAIRSKTEISIILLDIDHFKLYNDCYGHQAGDDCLKKVAAALHQTIHRPTDLAARFGGEEFAIILSETDAEGALTVAKQALENIKNLQIPHGQSPTSEFITVSLGIATNFAEIEKSSAVLIKSADDALYEAKKNGRNQIVSNQKDELFQPTGVLEEFAAIN